MKLPRTITIKGKQWRVRVKPKKLMLEDPDSWGLADCDDRIIYLDKSLDDEQRRWVFLHELCHAMLYESSVTRNTGGVPIALEEIICDNFADLLSSITISFTRPKKK